MPAKSFDEVVALKRDSIPEVIFTAFNNMIAEHLRGGISIFTLDEVLNEIERLDGPSRNAIFRHKWLDIEAAYYAQGWDVEFDQPGYCETYPATFTFMAK